MYSYLAYGLGIHSQLPLPELVPMAGAGRELEIRLEGVGGAVPQTDDSGRCFRLLREEAYLFWEEVGAFLVRGGREILIEPRAGVDERLIRLPLLGPVLATLLHQRGALVLHASSVGVEGKAIAFLGQRGWGKSTMAAALCARGHLLLTDDFVALEVCGAGSPLVLPGFPQLKLFPDAAAVSFGEDPTRLPRLADGFEKRARSAADGFSPAPLPLTQLYALGGGPVPSIERLPSREAVLELISHSYIGGVFKRGLDGAAASRQFLNCASLANRVSLRRLRRPPSLGALPEVARLVEADVAEPGALAQEESDPPEPFSYSIPAGSYDRTPA